MPGFDQSGPLGNGPKTGRGMGRCFTDYGTPTGQSAPNLGLGRGGRAYGCGMGRGAGMRNGMNMGPGRRNFSAPSQAERLEIEEELARARETISSLEARLKNLKPDVTE